MKIAIYQINPDRDENNVAFLNYENLERFQGSAALRSEIYDKVFEGEVEFAASTERCRPSAMLCWFCSLWWES